MRSSLVQCPLSSLTSYNNLKMIKTSETTEDYAITEPSSPPNVDSLHAEAQPEELPSHHDNIQFIISSNEELIHMQTMTIKSLQAANEGQQQEIKALREQYQILLQFIPEGSSFVTGKGQHQSAGHQPHLPHNPQINVEQMVDKIGELEQELLKTKMAFAISSEELLSFSLKKQKEEPSHTTCPNCEEGQINKDTYLNYFQTEPYEKYSSNDKDVTSEGKQLIQLWTKHLATTETVKLKEKSQSLIKKFIPKSLRGKVWNLLIENKIGITNCLYIHLLERRQKNWVCDKVKVQIDKDIKRSFYGKTQYETKTGLILEVCQFLEIFHIFRPDVSYVQGMTYPAIILIPILGKIKAFTVFCNLLLGNSFFRRVFSLEEGFVENVCHAFDILLMDFHPNLAKKMQKLAVESKIFIIEWLFTLFSRSLSFEATLKLWDHILFFQELAIFRISLSIFQQLGPLILQSDYEQIINSIRNFGSNLSEGSLLESISSSKLTKQKVNRALQKAVKGK